MIKTAILITLAVVIFLPLVTSGPGEHREIGNPKPTYTPSPTPSATPSPFLFPFPTVTPGACYEKIHTPR